MRHRVQRLLPSRIAWGPLGVVLGAALLFASEVDACSVCFGAPDSAQTASVNNAILFLLGVTACVLASFATFFLVLRRRMRRTVAGPDLASVALERRREPAGTAK
ncbi:MAG TPA: hypothetical protein VK116_00635 [Planctomycetota bacterium]|nr:hypothetical protein [Planctomycetota bacterium]